VVERNMQEIKEEFNKVVLSIFGSNIWKVNEVCFPSYKIKIRNKWTNNTKVLLDREHK
jgi:hypothetical protein